MAQHRTHDRLAMSANVEGFKLPMGCLMTSTFILLPNLTMGLGLARAGSLGDIVFVVGIHVAVIAGLFLSQKRTRVGRG